MYHPVKFAFLLFSTALLTACATSSTMLTERWKDQNYNERISRIIVVGISESESRRRLFEDTLVAQLNKRGVEAFSSAELISAEKEVNKESILAAVKEKSIDSVIVTRLVSVDEQATYLPGSVTVDSSGHYRPGQDYYYNFNDYYTESTSSTTLTPGNVVTDTIVSLETNLYETKQQQLVWSVTSETFNPNDINKSIQKLSETIVNRLSKDRLI